MAKAVRNRDLVDVLKTIVGDDHVLGTPEDMLVFEFDGSIEKRPPQAVVLPASAEQVSRIVRLAYEQGVPVVPRGAGTGLSGGAVAIEGGILLVMTRMNRILEVDTTNRFAVVEPGVVNQHVTQQVAEHNLMYVPDPSSQKTCTIGGNVAENSGGPHCLAYGVTTNHVLGVEVVLPDGEMVWLGGFEQDRPGYDLLGAFVGSEGTLGVATKVMVKLVPEPEAVKTLVAPFKDIDDASRAVSTIIARGIIPAALEMMDRMTIDAVGPVVRADYPPDADAVLLIEVDGPREAVDADAASVESICIELGAQEVRGAEDPKQRERLWAARKGALGALGRLAPNYYILDGVGPRTRLPEVRRRVNDICKTHGVRVSNVFHAGDGNLHPNVLFDERVEGEADRVLGVGEEIMRACVDAGGSITGEHGVGLEKKSFMRLMFTEEDLATMTKVKQAFGATENFNPCKILPTGIACGEGWKLSRLPSIPGAYL